MIDPRGQREGLAGRWGYIDRRVRRCGRRSADVAQGHRRDKRTLHRIIVGTQDREAAGDL